MTTSAPEPALLEPWRRDAAEVAAELGTDVGRGLSAADAAARLERYGPNELEAAAAVPGWRKFPPPISLSTSLRE